MNIYSEMNNTKVHLLNGELFKKIKKRGYGYGRKQDK